MKKVVICMFFGGTYSKCDKGGYLHVVLRELVQDVKNVVISMFFEGTCSNVKYVVICMFFRGFMLKT